MKKRVSLHVFLKGTMSGSDEGSMPYLRTMSPQKRAFFLTLSLVVVLLEALYAQELAASNSALRSLRGVNAVRVIAEDLSLAMQKTGLRKEQLVGTAEETLRKNGITVLGNHEPGKVPLVYVRLSSVFADEGGTGPISFYLTLQLKQPATLRNGESTATQANTETGEAPLLVTTWENGTMAMVSREELFFYIKQTLLNLVGDLTRDYQEANASRVSRAQ